MRVEMECEYRRESREEVRVEKKCEERRRVSRGGVRVEEECE